MHPSVLFSLRPNPIPTRLEQPTTTTREIMMETSMVATITAPTHKTSLSSEKSLSHHDPNIPLNIVINFEGFLTWSNIVRNYLIFGQIRMRSPIHELRPRAV